MASREPRTKSIRRQSKACKRCLKRKQRCHGFPICSACAEAKQPCEQSEYALQLHHHDSSFAAFKRIQSLEAQLASALEELSASRQAQQSLAYTPSDFVIGRQSQDDPGPGQLQTPLMLDEGFVSTTNIATEYTRGSDEGTAGNQAGLGSGSGPFAATPSLGSGDVPLGRGAGIDGMGLAMDRSPLGSSMEQMLQTTVWEKALSAAGGHNAFTPGSQPDSHLRSAAPPDEAWGRRMLEAYFEKIHPRYPFLERAELVRLHAQRYDTVPATAVNGFGTFKLNMVYAIGGTLLKLTDPYSETQAEGFFAAALQNVSSVRQSYTLETIEGMALLVLYNLRSLTNTGIWHIIGLAMQTCIDHGLHLESSYAAESSLFQSQKKRRLFWSVYLLERIIALSLRRPFSIADHDIETRIPVEGEETFLVQDSGANNSPVDASQAEPGGRLLMWTKFIQIKRFESRIQTDVYCLNETRQQRFAKIEPLLASLDVWIQSLPYLPESERSYLHLQWNKAVSQLLRPFLSMMRSNNPLIARCLTASGQVCDIFKRMHQRDSYGHSFVSAHSTFIAGVTMCYCLFLAPNHFSNSVANSLRACSSTMFVIAERFHKLRKHRDILEDIIGRIVDSRGVPGSNHVDFNGLQKQQFSQLDFIAVQSLLNLAAQQEPQEISTFENPQRPDVHSAGVSLALQPTDENMDPASFVAVQRPVLEQDAWRPVPMSSAVEAWKCWAEW
ncbi:c6 zinc finger domain containing protein [Niveomyces insectorum RCEF 264]|uniref:C6 zinc finger domain containing protein n=1 Tax=Niveomyces insectorum RCEF 264 TaxID=1081102 RepID=A0A167SLF0_9HYPO|nr:c6 zinc finger domain containing protein [Niveomyces insectorum RCEF 264]